MHNQDIDFLTALPCLNKYVIYFVLATMTPIDAKMRTSSSVIFCRHLENNVSPALEIPYSDWTMFTFA